MSVLDLAYIWYIWWTAFLLGSPWRVIAMILNLTRLPGLTSRPLQCCRGEASIIHTSLHLSSWAKNRFGLYDRIPFSFLLFPQRR